MGRRMEKVPSAAEEEGRTVVAFAETAIRSTRITTGWRDTRLAIVVGAELLEREGEREGAGTRRACPCSVPCRDSTVKPTSPDSRRSPPPLLSPPTSLSSCRRPAFSSRTAMRSACSPPSPTSTAWCARVARRTSTACSSPSLPTTFP